MKRLWGVVIFIGGFALILLGIGMWRSPEIDWGGFLDAWSLVVNDVARLIHDPFAVLGSVVLIIGVFIALNGLWRVVRG